jgi:hypothetical protein
MEHTLDELRGFGSGQAKPVMDDVREVGASQCPAQFRLITHPCNAEVGHLLLPLKIAALPLPRQLHLRNGNPSCRQCDIVD